MPKLYKDNKISRSAELRKYASAYKSYTRKLEHSKINKSPRRTRKKEKIHNSKIHRISSRSKKEKNNIKRKNTPKYKRKTLNSYQKFVKQESKKELYKKMSGKERLTAIASKWKKINKE